ncbi:MAG: hypothetical protein SOR89_03440 [Ndongobacter sp.]|nr:hypothetical protein [Ndongobacter sp.]
MGQQENPRYESGSEKGEARYQSGGERARYSYSGGPYTKNPYGNEDRHARYDSSRSAEETPFEEDASSNRDASAESLNRDASADEKPESGQEYASRDSREEPRRAGGWKDITAGWARTIDRSIGRLFEEVFRSTSNMWLLFGACCVISWLRFFGIGRLIGAPIAIGVSWFICWLLVSLWGGISGVTREKGRAKGLAGAWVLMSSILNLMLIPIGVRFIVNVGVALILLGLDWPTVVQNSGNSVEEQNALGARHGLVLVIMSVVIGLVLYLVLQLLLSVFLALGGGWLIDGLRDLSL